MTERDSDTIRRRVEQYYTQRSEFNIHLIVFIVMNAIFWGIWLFTHTLAPIASWPWPSIITLAWGSGLAAHWLEFRSKSPGRLALVDRLVEDQMTELYGPDWRDVADEDVYRNIRQAAHKRQRHNTEFAIHLAVFALINVMLGLLWQGITQGVGLRLDLIIMALWGAGLAAHGASIFFDSSRSIVAREKAVQQALGTDIPKKKRLEQARTVLTDDGELLEVIDDEQEETEGGFLHHAE